MQRRADMESRRRAVTPITKTTIVREPAARAATAVCSLPHARRACPGRDFLLRKSGKPDLRWGRAGEGGSSY